MKTVIARIVLVVSVFLMEYGEYHNIQAQEYKDYYERYTHLNFRNDKIFNEVIDLNEPDIRRLQAVIFFLTNEIRVKFRLLPVAYSNNLERQRRCMPKPWLRKISSVILIPVRSR